MIIQVWLLLTIIAFVVLAYALLAPDDEIALITSVAGIFLWLVVAYGALNIETFSRQQDMYIQQSEPAIALLAVAGVLLCLINGAYIAFDWAHDESR